MRVTEQLLQVAEVLMADPQGDFWGYDLGQRARLRSGVLYPLLHRLLEEGWLEDGWETPGTGKRKAPPRRYYRLTELGAAKLGAVLASRARVAVDVRSWQPKFS